MPAASMVESWRAKVAMSPGVGLAPEPNDRCLRILVGTMFWRRRSARTSCSLTARIFPRSLLPLRSLPSPLYWRSLAAATAVGGMVSVVLYPDCRMLSPGVSLNCDAVDFFEAGLAVPDLF